MQTLNAKYCTHNKTLSTKFTHSVSYSTNLYVTLIPCEYVMACPQVVRG
jgi:hypothetical protein